MRGVSVPVALDRLYAEVERFGRSPYLLTVAADGRPHAVAVTVRWRGDELVASAGNRTRANAAERPLVSLLWPPAEPGGFSLIVDGTAADADGGGVSVRPTTAVLHRPAPREPGDDRDSSCGSDCVPLDQG